MQPSDLSTEPSPSDVIAFINRGSGTVMSLGAEAARALVADRLKARFPDLTVELFEGDILPLLEARLRAHPGGVIIVGGGDGTISSAGGALSGTDATLAPLPMGTMNLFVRALGYSPKLPEALDQLAAALERRVDIGRANGRVFLHQVSFGLQPRMARLRARLGYRSRLTKILASMRAFLIVALNPRAVRVTMETDGASASVKTPLLVVSNNPLAERGPIGVQESLDTGVLGLYLLRDFSLPLLFRLARDYLTGRVRHNPAFDIRTAHEVTISRRLRPWSHRLRRARRRRILVSIDGELVYLDWPVRITIEPQALTVLGARAG